MLYKAKDVGVSVRDCLHLVRAIIEFGPFIPGFEEMSGLREYVVVNETGVDGEESHKQDDVAPAKEGNVSHTSRNLGMDALEKLSKDLENTKSVLRST